MRCAISVQAALFLTATMGCAARLTQVGGQGLRNAAQERAAMKGETDMQAFKQDVSSHWDTVTVNTTSGPLLGACHPTDDVCVFLGVPFALPPTGERRWMSAKSLTVNNWTSPLDCKWFRPACMQKMMPADPGVSEDCLYMNIYLPKQSLPGSSTYKKAMDFGRGGQSPRLLPSMVFTFGGSWEIGSGANAGGVGLMGMTWYDGTSPVKIASAAGTPTIIIAINYRVNAFHALASPSLKTYNQAHSEGEAGTGAISDQRMAYTWWTANAKSFGGDPTRRTIYGESAGAGSVSIHLTSPPSWSLFDQAITESGPAADWTSQPMERANKTWVEFATRGNCPVAGEESVSCLRALPASFFVDQVFPDATLIRGLHHGLKWAPVVDGVVVIQAPKAAMNAGTISSSKPALFHTNRNEMTVLASFSQKINESDYVPYLMSRHFNHSTAELIKTTYPPANYTAVAQGGSTATFQALSAAFTDFAMFCPSRRMSIARNQKRLKEGLPADNSFNGVLMHENAIIHDLLPADGVPHVMELISVWDIKMFIWTKPDEAMAKFYIETWTHFAHHGTPALPSNATTGSWMPFTLSRNETTPGQDSSFLTHSDKAHGAYGVNTPDFRRGHCELWDRLEHDI